MITIEAMVTRLKRGDEKEQSGIFASASTALPRLAGTLVTVAGFPIGFARSAAGEYTFSIFAVVAIALIASWGVAAVFAPLLGVWILTGPIMRTFHRFLELAVRARWVTILVTLGCSEQRSMACVSCHSSSFRHLTGPSCSSTCSCPRTRRSTQPGTSQREWTSS